MLIPHVTYNTWLSGLFVRPANDIWGASVSSRYHEQTRPVRFGFASHALPCHVGSTGVIMRVSVQARGGHSDGGAARHLSVQPARGHAVQR